MDTKQSTANTTESKITVQMTTADTNIMFSMKESAKNNAIIHCANSAGGEKQLLNNFGNIPNTNCL